MRYEPSIRYLTNVNSLVETGKGAVKAQKTTERESFTATCRALISKSTQESCKKHRAHFVKLRSLQLWLQTSAPLG
jgi:hypothetical protein